MDNVDKLKVAELRSELESRGLDTKGTKPILVKVRLFDIFIKVTYYIRTIMAQYYVALLLIELHAPFRLFGDFSIVSNLQIFGFFKRILFL